MSLIVALPGFLGLANDWDILYPNHVKTINVMQFEWYSLAMWAAQFNNWISKHYNDYSKILMGYSLGGRLALHAVIDKPSQWNGAIIISAHPGLKDSMQKEARREEDWKWAQCFQNESWELVMNKWNSKNVFAYDQFNFHRQERDYIRTELAHILKYGSLGLQEDLQEKIKNIHIPILWITGDNDAHYCKIARTLIFSHTLSRAISIPQSSHRAPWQQPKLFLSAVNNWIGQL